MDDTISRQDAIDAAERESTRFGAYGYMDTKSIIDMLNDIPSAQRKGKWIATQEWGGRNYSCSCCKFSFIVDTCMLEPMWNFCPNCGADMRGGSEDE